MQEKENGHTNCKMKCMYDASNWEIKEKGRQLSETMRNGRRLHWKPRSVTDCRAQGEGWRWRRRKKRWNGR